MNRLPSLLRGGFFLLLGAPLAHALLVKPNVAPVVSGPIGDRQQYSDTIAIIDLSGFFRDPDASAAARLMTPLGTMNFTLDGETAPNTVQNFLNYLNQGRYFKIDPANGQLASTFFHRAETNFVIQGGGYLSTIDPSSSTGVIQPTQVEPFSAVQNEPFISNRRGTIAMARIGGSPNSATSQWFVNLADNSGGAPALDTTDGGFTVFGRVAGAGMAVADAIVALPPFNGPAPFNQLPLRGYSSGVVKPIHLVTVPEFSQISPLVFSATSNNPGVASVATSGTQLLVTGHQVGSAQINVTATDLDGVPISQSFNVNLTAAPGRMRNIATRVNFPTGNEVLIGGFIIGAGGAKRLAVRAIGPSLGVGPGAIGNALNNPTLELRDANMALLASNDNWADSPDKQLLTDIGLAPTSANESALILIVPASATYAGYTAVVRSVGSTPGVSLVEVYDLDSGAGGPSLLNLSTRGAVGGGDSVMIGGFITGGTGSRRLIVRALGPSLSEAGVTGTLPDPTLELRDSNGTVVNSNNDWQSDATAAAEIESYGVGPHNPLESALVSTVPSGAYTAVVAGNGSQPTGVALVEIFQVL